ncbi:MAG: YggT family protein [Clostridia bacterium]|nr:YggT family protein [Clostridia bacterium]
MFNISVIIIKTADLLLWAMSFLMFIRMIMSWIPMDDDNPVSDFVYGATEIIISPVRAVMVHFNIMQDTPLDMSFMVTALLLIIIRMFLPSF